MRSPSLLFHDNFPDDAIGIAENVNRTKAVEDLRRAFSFTFLDAGRQWDGEAEGGKAVLDFHVEERLIHEQRAVGIGMDERGGRLGRVGQRVVGLIRIRPASVFINTGLIIGREENIPLTSRDLLAVIFIGRMVGSFLRTSPNTRVIVDVKDHDATAWKAGIPALPLTILDDIIFIGIAIVTNEVGLRFVSKGRHIADLSNISQFDRFEPSHEPTFVG